MRYLLEDDEHMDAVFILDDGMKIRAHKSILTARADYFKALFRSDTFRESELSTITVEPDFTEQQVRSVLSFIYCNQVPRLDNASTDNLLALFRLADQWLLAGLKKQVEDQLVHHVADDTVARLFVACEDYGASHLLTKACVDYIRSNLKHLTNDPDFEEALQRHSPALTMHILKRAAAADEPLAIVPSSPSSRHSVKRVRRSSPVPDAEPSSGGLSNLMFDM